MYNLTPFLSIARNESSVAVSVAVQGNLTFVWLGAARLSNHPTLAHTCSHSARARSHPLSPALTRSRPSSLTHTRSINNEYILAAVMSMYAKWEYKAPPWSMHALYRA